MSEFLHMGGYATFVWSSYAVFAAVLIWSTLAPVIRRRALLRGLTEREALLARKENAR